MPEFSCPFLVQPITLPAALHTSPVADTMKDPQGHMRARATEKGNAVMKTNDQKSKPLTRRDFMRGAAVAGAAAGATVTRTARADLYKSILPASVLGANEIIRTGHIGLGGMGRADLTFVMQRNDMMPIALCDLWYKNLDRAGQMLSQKNKDFTTHHDFREIIENKDIDAVVIATPDHWHALCTIYAAEAKKDIYCEKPCATTIAEGKAMIKAVRDNKVVFQAGNMQRSGTHFQKAVELVRSGYLGAVSRVECYIHDGESIEGIGPGDDNIDNYKGIDWEFHQGWVEHKPFNSNRWIYNFRWFLDYSGGKITDWGAHLIDIGLWGMGDVDIEPKSVASQGGKFVVTDNRTTPDTFDVLWEFDNFVLSFSNRVWNRFLPQGFQDHGTIFHGTLGTLRVDRSGFEVYPVPNNKTPAAALKEGASQLNEPHWENFANCVRDRKDPISRVEVIEHTTKICHMGTAAHVTNAKLHWDSATQSFIGGDTEATAKANAWVNRPYNNGWSLEAPHKKA